MDFPLIFSHCIKPGLSTKPTPPKTKHNLASSARPLRSKYVSLIAGT